MGVSARDLFESQTYRKFIERWLEFREQQKHPLSYADISRRAGFASRSFPRDVLLGKKRLTIASLYPMIRGLGLFGDFASFFKLLIEAEHPDCRTGKISDEQILRRLQHFRSRTNKQFLSSLRDPKTTVNTKLALFQVFASLGNESGATIKDIIKRSGLPKYDVTKMLQILTTSGAIQQDGTRWKANLGHLNATGLEKSDGFEKIFKEAHSSALTALPHLFGTEEALYFVTCFSVNQYKLPEIKSRLRALLLEYAEKK